MCWDPPRFACRVSVVDHLIKQVLRTRKHGIEIKKEFKHTIVIAMKIASQPNFLLERKVNLKATVSKAKLARVHSSHVRRGPRSGTYSFCDREYAYASGTRKKIHCYNLSQRSVHVIL
jgi:hypothetical protein